MDCGIDEGQDVRDEFIDHNYDEHIDFNDNYTFTLPTNYGYNVTYDMNFLIDGQGDRGFYTLTGNGDDLIVFSLDNENVLTNAYRKLGTPQCNKTITLGIDYDDINTFNYSFAGYVYRQKDSDSGTLPYTANILFISHL